jgi:hypothetical protein
VPADRLLLEILAVEEHFPAVLLEAITTTAPFGLQMEDLVGVQVLSIRVVVLEAGIQEVDLPLQDHSV